MPYIPIDIDAAIKKECRRRRYSSRTIKTYLFCIHRFLNWSKKELGHISKKDVRLFLEQLSDRGRAGNTLNTYHMAIRFLFQDVLKKQIWLDIKYSKVPENLPVVLTKDEIRRLFEAIKNPKHKLIVQLMYSTGLRVSELINLRVNDLEIERGYGFVRRGKGDKDRIFIIAEKLKPKLKELITKEELDPTSQLFRSNREKKYDISSFRRIIKVACKKAKINKNISCHTLRHSFATHLIENGYSVSEVQAMLGHKSPETTFVYLHTASPNLIKIKSPIDEL